MPFCAVSAVVVLASNSIDLVAGCFCFHFPFSLVCARLFVVLCLVAFTTHWHRACCRSMCVLSHSLADSLITMTPPVHSLSFAANAGDSRAVLARKGKPLALSLDHKPGIPEEKDRITAAGGQVRKLKRGGFCCWKTSLGPLRVFPGESGSRDTGGKLWWHNRQWCELSGNHTCVPKWSCILFFGLLN